MRKEEMKGRSRNLMVKEKTGRARNLLMNMGLSLASMAATRVLSRAVQNDRRRWFLRLFGSRKLESGLTMLARTRRLPWTWGKVAGDVMSLVTLSSAFANKKRRRGRIGAILAAVAGITALDIIYGRRMSKSH